MRWPDGVRCTSCASDQVNKRGHHDTHVHRQRYQCKKCNIRFDDLTGTALANHHQPLNKWILCLYLMGHNLSNAMIGRELNICEDDAQGMTTALREGIEEKKLLNSLAETLSAMKST